MEKVKVLYLKLVKIVRELPDPIEIGFYWMLGGLIGVLINGLPEFEVNTFGYFLIGFITNVLSYLRLKIDHKKLDDK